MNKVPINNLKIRLAFWTLKAAQGETIHVTKHNRPFVLLGPDTESGLTIGKRIGQGALVPLLKKATHGRWLNVLGEDRNET